jgi:hypothetical protein
MNKSQGLNIELMFSSLLSQANAIVTSLKDIDPKSEAYGVALNNLAKSFAILGGSTINKGDKDGDK